MVTWEKVTAELKINENSKYLVKTNGSEWSDSSLLLLHGIQIKHRLEPEFIRGRPLYICEINEPNNEGDVSCN